jgi:hypothetical protein
MRRKSIPPTPRSSWKLLTACRCTSTAKTIEVRREGRRGGSFVFYKVKGESTEAGLKSPVRAAGPDRRCLHADEDRVYRGATQRMQGRALNIPRRLLRWDDRVRRRARIRVVRRGPGRRAHERQPGIGVAVPSVQRLEAPPERVAALGFRLRQEAPRRGSDAGRHQRPLRLRSHRLRRTRCQGPRADWLPRPAAGRTGGDGSLSWDLLRSRPLGLLLRPRHRHCHGAPAAALQRRWDLQAPPPRSQLWRSTIQIPFLGTDRSSISGGHCKAELRRHIPYDE